MLIGGIKASPYYPYSLWYSLHRQRWRGSRRQAATFQVQRCVLLLVDVSLLSFSAPFNVVSLLSPLSSLCLLCNSPVDMLHSFFPQYSFSFIFYGHFFQITLLKLCKFRFQLNSITACSLLFLRFFYQSTLIYAVLGDILTC